MATVSSPASFSLRLVSADSTAELIRRARFDDQVKAVVLRVDSGGGSAFASEVIRRELELTRAAGKKVVVSMASVAASGGYWIASQADRIIAEPTTLTGSIGVFGGKFALGEALARFGVDVRGIGVGSEFADAYGVLNMGPTFPLNLRQDVDVVLVGLNYRFGGSGPVVARY